MLHTVNKSPFEKSTLKSCLAHARDGDAVLLIEDAVYGAMKGTDAAGEIWPRKGRFAFFVLGPDLAARGLDPARLIDGFTVIDYEGFVDLVVEHDTTQSWL